MYNEPAFALCSETAIYEENKMQILSQNRLALWRRSGLLAVAIVAMLWLASCTGTAVAPAAQPTAAGTTAAGSSGTSAEHELTRNETLIFAADLSDLITLDPAVAYEFSGIQAAGSAYETLVSINPGKDGPQPLLAESWTISDTGDVWDITFHLNPAAKFASGKPVTAGDVAYSWGRAIDINKSPAFLFNDVAKLTKDEMTVVDDKTLEVKLPKTVSPGVFLSVASFTIAAVVEKAQVEANLGSDLGQTWLNDHSAGSGPYVISSWQRNTNITLDANPNYWGTAPLIQRVIMQNETENANLQASIETGDADIVQDLGPEQAKALEGNADVSLVKAESTLLVYVGMNAMKAPLDNVDVREAIRYAINYDDINTLLSGSGKIVQEIIPDTFLGHTGKTYFAQDVAKAKDLLSKAGVADGTEIEFLVPVGLAPGGLEWNVIASKIQSDLAAVVSSSTSSRSNKMLCSPPIALKAGRW